MDNGILPVKTDPLEGPTLIQICNPSSSITFLGQLHQSPPSRIPGDSIRPTQSMIYVPLQVNRFQQFILLIVQYKYSKSCSKDFILQNLRDKIMRYWVYYSTQLCF